MGMAGLLRHRSDVLIGILNGIDTVAWDAATDPALGTPFAHYDAKRLAAKAKNKTALQRLTGLADEPDIPLLGVVSRLTHQKGLDLLASAAEAVLALPAQLVILGSGEHHIEDTFRALGHAHPGRCAVTIGFDEALAHRIEAGADIFLMPSRFEPCGLNQMYSLRYGTPPVVRATGGLADTVIDAIDAGSGNGFVFAEPTVAALTATIRRAVETWHDKARWQQLQRAGMARDFSWAQPAKEYEALYAQLAG
jgi:starch synthase